jgi:hypothetical protein
MAQQDNKIDLGFDLRTFSGNYGFSIIYGPRRYAGIGIAISDGRGNFRAIQKLNIGTGQMLEQNIVGTYEVNPDGTGVARIKATLPDGQVVDGTFDYVVLQAVKRGNYKLGVELQGIDRQPAVNFATGQPLEPPQIGVSWFKSLP